MISLNNKITDLYSIKYPIIQGGMVWISGAKLAAAVANSGCLGLIGAGSMKPDLLKIHITKAQNSLTNTDGALGVNIPLLYSESLKQIETALDCGIKIFFTSAGSPKKYTKVIQDRGGIVTHVTSNPLLAKKCQDAGVDAIVAEGFEAGGHNGREEITTMSLIPQIRDCVSVPVIAAGGIFDARQVAAAICLGADGVQIGTGFAATIESSAHDNFKQAIVSSSYSDTKLLLKKDVPVRLLRNTFSKEIEDLENKCASAEELRAHLGKGRAKKGMLEGDIDHGELEIGQVSAMIKEIPSVNDYITKLTTDLDNLLRP
jgi:enoyl-[acyl-carrier protein] reductase II